MRASVPRPPPTSRLTPGGVSMSTYGTATGVSVGIMFEVDHYSRVRGLVFNAMSQGWEGLPRVTGA